MFLFYFFKIFILFYFILAASGLSCSTQDLSLWRGLLSSCGAQAPGHVGSVVCGMQALSLRRASSVVVAHGFSFPTARGILVPRPGIKPASPALEGGFFTTGRQGSPLSYSSLMTQGLLLNENI